MYQKNHVGVVKKTVVLEFENGYSITLEAGVEMSMSLTMNESRPTPRTADLLPCGHHKDALVENNDRQWCVACEMAASR